MDFQLNEEQLQLKKSVREFAEREIAPNVRRWDEAGEFPLAIVKELGKLGLMGVVFPAELGGAGMGYVEYVTAIEELSRVDGSVGIIVAAHTSRPCTAGSPTTSATSSSSVPPLGSATVASQRTPPFESWMAASLPPAKPAKAVSPSMVMPAGERMMSDEGAR